MMVSLKPDADEIARFLKQLAEQDWVKRSERRPWPQFLFHYTHILNAVSILTEGQLLSRQGTEERQKLSVSSGSSAVLAATDSDVKSCVRLYFRPQTPTQFNVEGVKSTATLAQSRFPDAHCPVPVFILFDSAQLLSRSDCWFSDGNLGSSKAERLSTAADLAALPWDRIYHVGQFDPQKEDITFRRSAEVAIEGTLDLDSLGYIYCRSEAEKETLLHLLPPDVRRKYRNRIVATSRANLFFRRHTFVENARLFANRAEFDFLPETASPGPFRIVVKVLVDSRAHVWKRTDFVANCNLAVPFSRSLETYDIEVKLDGHLVYANKFEEISVPF
jgi:hypothetical protein